MTLAYVHPIGLHRPLGSLPRPLERPSPMPAEYAEGRCRCINESPLGAVFCRQSNIAGAPGDVQYFDPDGPTWDNLYDADRHLARLHRETDESGKATEQSFAVPLAVSDDPTTFARVYVVGVGDELLSLYDTVSSNRMYGETRRWSSKP